MITPTTLLVRSVSLAAPGVRAWAVESQQGARRNAMIAATDCAQRRAQREEVADYLEHRRQRPPARRSRHA